MKLFLCIYRFLQQHRLALWAVVLPLVVCMVVLSTRLRYQEDIMDFLPVGADYQESMQIYSSLQEAARIVIIFESDAPDSICSAIDAYADRVEGTISEVDIEPFIERLQYVHQHMPLVLSDSSYLALDTLLSREAIRRRMTQCRTMLSMPGSSVFSRTLASDPLGLVPFSMGASGQYAGARSHFTTYHDYMLTADQRMGFCFYDSPYGSTESMRNGPLVDSLQQAARSVMASHPSVSVRLLGAPVVSVGNARRIKADCIWAITLSMLFITLLLLYAFPRKRDILLILLAVGFGWLTGMVALWLVADEVSAIVLGIGSVLIGVAVNYPLHLLVHQRYTSSVEQTLREVLQPLMIGNITTVGAFAALIPLHAVALRDLGIFSAALLIGTILFCVLILPHLMKAEPTPIREIRLPNCLTRLTNDVSAALPFRADAPLRHPIFHGLVGLLFIAALAYGIASPAPLFDPNPSHLNYMTPQQRADFAFFETLSGQSRQPAYLAASARAELQHRATLWHDFWQLHNADSVANIIEQEAQAAGFREGTFAPFESLIRTPFDADIASDTELLTHLWPGRFDSAALNSQLTTSLSAHFDYLGLVCSALVFLFLLLSFRSFALALVAFLPMVVSWVWIVALMKLLGLQFNIVNVILATFIFGQGDDYTIFILEGLLYELRTGRKMLHQYKQSILLSAIIMLVGIGVLIIARHPAMHSLGAVTLVGMIAVVWMAYLVPPILLRLLLRVPFLRQRILHD